MTKPRIITDIMSAEIKRIKIRISSLKVKWTEISFERLLSYFLCFM